jgi:hypothetical protein
MKVSDNLFPELLVLSFFFAKEDKIGRSCSTNEDE